MLAISFHAAVGLLLDPNRSARPQMALTLSASIHAKRSPSKLDLGLVVLQVPLLLRGVIARLPNTRVLFVNTGQFP